jgi:hypothetical protein
MRRLEMEAAIRLAELCWQSVMQLSYLATSSKDVRDRRAVISVLNTMEWITAGAIGRSVPEVGLKKRLGEVLETLVDERAILKFDRGGQTMYRLATAEEVEKGGPDLVAPLGPLGDGSKAPASEAPQEPEEPRGQILPFPSGG